VAAWAELPLARKFEAPAGVQPPDLAVVMVDGGRLQLRDPPGGTPADERQGQPRGAGSSPQGSLNEETPPQGQPGQPAGEADWAEEPPSKGSHWHEDKIGLLLAMHSRVHDSDPCPEIPPGFLDATRIPKLVRELGKSLSPSEDAVGEAKDPQAEEEAVKEEPQYQPPGVLQRQLVATARPWRAFAPIAASAAYLRGLQGAKRKAFVADGSANNWVLQRRHFGSFVPVLDFIHALSYVFAGAMAGRPFPEGWARYRGWVGWLWQGQVGRVIEALEQRRRQVGLPREDDGETSVRQVVARALGYLSNHRGKMKYDEYRRQGLPITSSLMESAVKQINERVKGTEKFWSEGGGEALLQLRADALGDEGQMEAFWQRRQAAATGQRRYRRRAG